MQGFRCRLLKFILDSGSSGAVVLEILVLVLGWVHVTLFYFSLTVGDTYLVFCLSI